MALGWLKNARFELRFFKRSLQNRFMEMMPPFFSVDLSA